MTNHAIPSPTPRATALEKTFKSKANNERVTQRLYTCDNGLKLGAIRGGAMAQSDGTNWEVFTLGDNDTLVGEAVGFIDEEQLQRLVVLLAGWRDEAAA